MPMVRPRPRPVWKKAETSAGLEEGLAAPGNDPQQPQAGQHRRAGRRGDDRRESAGGVEPLHEAAPIVAGRTDGGLDETGQQKTRAGPEHAAEDVDHTQDE